MATTTQSRKAKGRRLQQDVVKELLKRFPDLTERDIASTPMGCTGVDIKLSEQAAKQIPFDIECKNTEKLNIWDALEQATGREGRIPLLIFKRNRSDTFCCLKLEDLLNLLWSCYG